MVGTQLWPSPSPVPSSASHGRTLARLWRFYLVYTESSPSPLAPRYTCRPPHLVVTPLEQRSAPSRPRSGGFGALASLSSPPYATAAEQHRGRAPYLEQSPVASRALFSSRPGPVWALLHLCAPAALAEVLRTRYVLPAAAFIDSSLDFTGARRYRLPSCSSFYPVCAPPRRRVPHTLHRVWERSGFSPMTDLIEYRYFVPMCSSVAMTDSCTRWRR